MNVDAAVAGAFRDEWGQVVATLIGLTGDWDLAEECAQDAFATALERWPHDGIPRRPGAWLTAVARNRATDPAAPDVHLLPPVASVYGAASGEAPCTSP